MVRFIATLLCISTILTGCTSVIPKDKETIKKLESYEETIESPKSPYEYLTEVTLGNEDLTVSVYLPDTDNLKIEEDSASASLDGITASATLFEETEDVSLGDVLQKKYEEEKGRIEKLKGMENLNVSDLIEGDNYKLIEMDYTLNGFCISVLKMDDLGDGFYLLSYINVDASGLTDNSGAVLKEILDVYGVDLGI